MTMGLFDILAALTLMRVGVCKPTSAFAATGFGRDIFGGCFILKVVKRLWRVPGELSSSELSTLSMKLAGARSDVTLQWLSLWVEAAPPLPCISDGSIFSR